MSPGGVGSLKSVEKVVRIILMALTQKGIMLQIIRKENYLLNDSTEHNTRSLVLKLPYSCY